MIGTGSPSPHNRLPVLNAPHARKFENFTALQAALRIQSVTTAKVLFLTYECRYDIRRIARELDISRKSVKRELAGGKEEVLRIRDAVGADLGTWIKENILNAFDTEASLENDLDFSTQTRDPTSRPFEDHELEARFQDSDSAALIDLIKLPEIQARCLFIVYEEGLKNPEEAARKLRMQSRQIPLFCATGVAFLRTHTPAVLEQVPGFLASKLAKAIPDLMIEESAGEVSIALDSAETPVDMMDQRVIAEPPVEASTEIIESDTSIGVDQRVIPENWNTALIVSPSALLQILIDLTLIC
jgi:hypothetical protein